MQHTSCEERSTLIRKAHIKRTKEKDTTYPVTYSYRPVMMVGHIVDVTVSKILTCMELAMTTLVQNVMVHVTSQGRCFFFFFFCQFNADSFSRNYKPEVTFVIPYTLTTNEQVQVIMLVHVAHVQLVGPDIHVGLV